MVIDVIAQNINLKETTRQRIIDKFSAAVKKYLNGMEEDLKKATVSIQKMPRFGYLLKFDMQLPWTHIYVQQNSPLLFVGVINLQRRVARQIREEAERMKERRK